MTQSDLNDDFGDDDDFENILDSKITTTTSKSTTESTQTSTITNTEATSFEIPTVPSNGKIPPNCPISERDFQTKVFKNFRNMNDCPGVLIYSASATFNSIPTGNGPSVNLQMRAPLKDSNSPEFYIVSGLMKQTVSNFRKFFKIKILIMILIVIP